MLGVFFRVRAPPRYQMLPTETDLNMRPPHIPKNFPEKVLPIGAVPSSINTSGGMLSCSQFLKPIFFSFFSLKGIELIRFNVCSR